MSQDPVCLFQERYGHWRADENSPQWSPALTLLLRHTSVRHYLQDTLPDGLLETLVAAGQSASTSSMLQTWSAIAITDHDRKNAVAMLAGDQDFIRQAPLFILFCADLNRLATISKKLQKPGNALKRTDMFIMASIDAALAAQNMAIAAESLGLGICYVGAARNNASDITELLQLPPRVIGLFGMTVGKPNPDRLNAIKPRLPMDEVLHREVWNNVGQEDRISAYDQTLGSFYEGQKKLHRKPWSFHSASFVASDELDGRERMRHTLDEQGFHFD